MTDQLSGWVPMIAAGDSQALERFYDATCRRVYSLALRILRRPDEAEEVVMDVYAQVWRTAARFDATRGTVEAWLLNIARARAIDRLRARRARPDTTAAGLEDAEAPASLRAEAADLPSWDARRQTEAMLRRLSAGDRRLIELAYFDGYTHSELAELLQLPLGTIKTRLRRILQTLRTRPARDSEGGAFLVQLTG